MRLVINNSLIKLIITAIGLQKYKDIFSEFSFFFKMIIHILYRYDIGSMNSDNFLGHRLKYR